MNFLSHFLQTLSTAGTHVKILAFFSCWLVIWLPIAIPLAIWLKWHPLKPITLQQKIPLVLSLYALVPVLLWGVSKFGGIAIAELGWQLTRSTLIAGLLGLGLGIVGVWLTYALQWRLAWVQWNSTWFGQAMPTVLPALALGVIVGAIEESVFRGFLLSQLRLELSSITAVLLSSLVFAIAHLLWDGFAGFAQLPGLWLMGIVLAIAVSVTNGNLGLASGLHAGWIWALAVLDSAQLTKPTGQVSTWLTGEAGQVLTGVVGILLLTSTGIGLAAYYWLSN